MLFPSLSGPAAARRAGALAALLVALPLGGCYTVNRTVPTASVPPDYHDRHQVVLANEPNYLDIFPVGATGKLDQRQAHDLAAFAASYRQMGQGLMVMRVPSGPVDPVATQRTADAVRHALLSYGISGGIRMGSYPVGNPQLASPIHLSYTGLQARVTSHCGDWPDDLDSGSSLNGWENQTYYNLGCADTKTLTAQIDDPRDVLRPRADQPTDVQLRTRAIGNLRSGKDPGTTWSTSLAPTAGIGTP